MYGFIKYILVTELDISLYARYLFEIIAKRPKLYLDNEVKITISDEVKEIVAEQVSNRAEYEKEIRKLEIRAKYKNELEKMEDKKFNELSLGQQLVVELAYKINLIEFT